MPAKTFCPFFHAGHEIPHTDLKNMPGGVKHPSFFIPGVRFSKVPKLYGPFSGVAVPFVSQERRGFKSSNFTVLFLFGPLKGGLSKTSGWQFHKWLFGPKKFSGHSRNGPQA